MLRHCCCPHGDGGTRHLMVWELGKKSMHMSEGGLTWAAEHEWGEVRTRVQCTPMLGTFAFWQIHRKTGTRLCLARVLSLPRKTTSGGVVEYASESLTPPEKVGSSTEQPNGVKWRHTWCTGERPGCDPSAATARAVLRAGRLQKYNDDSNTGIGVER